MDYTFQILNKKTNIEFNFYYLEPKQINLNKLSVFRFYV